MIEIKTKKAPAPASPQPKKQGLSEFRPGWTIKVFLRITEGEKTRLQPFEGIVIAKKHGTEPGATFTVRRIAEGIGVERIFPLHSPLIDHIDIIKKAKVRRAKLYYLRGRQGKAAKIKAKRTIK